jgi:hypothetical protein
MQIVFASEAKQSQFILMRSPRTQWVLAMTGMAFF